MSERFFSIDFLAGAGLEVLDAQEGLFSRSDSHGDDSNTGEPETITAEPEQPSFDPFKGS